MSGEPVVLPRGSSDSQPGAEFMFKEHFRRRGFLPETDPLNAFPSSSELALLDEIGRDLPSLLYDRGFRQFARTLELPPWPTDSVSAEDLPALRLYYVRVGFLASAYVNQVGQPPATILPANIAIPLVRACQLLQRPPILSYDGYALYNWKRFRKDGPIALGNIDTIQNFVHLYDEHWFILIHVEIEQIASHLMAGVDLTARGIAAGDRGLVNRGLQKVGESVSDQI